MRRVRVGLRLMTIMATVVAGPTPARAAVVECVVPSNYAEAAEENAAVLLKVLAMLEGPGSPIEDFDTATLYFTMLASTRRHLERSREGLPSCAQPVNRALIDTVAASQGALAMQMAVAAEPDSRRHPANLERAKEWLGKSWQALSVTRNETPIIPAASN